MAGSHEVRGSIPLGSTIFATTDAMHPSFFYCARIASDDGKRGEG